MDILPWGKIKPIYKSTYKTNIVGSVRRFDLHKSTYVLFIVMDTAIA